MIKKEGAQMAKEFERKELYAVYLSASEWMRVMECLFNNEHTGLAEYIGDEIGVMIAIHPDKLDAKNSCMTCMHRDECVIRCSPPICNNYLNVKVVE